MRIRFMAVLFGLVFAAAPALAADSMIEISQAWARAGATTTGAAYLTIVNHTSSDDVLTGVSSPIAGKAEMHVTVHQGDVMEMREMPQAEIKAGATLNFAPTAMHIMLMNLSHPLKAGDRFPLTLTFAHAGPVTATVTVSKDAPSAPSGHDMSMPGMKM